MKYLKKYIFLFILLVSVLTGAQELSPIKNFTPNSYGAENQNWGISQSSEKYIYVANNKGLLEYNGASWKLYNSPNNTVLRSVKVINKKIYTGCYMEFGYWEKDEFNQLKYTSLSSEIKEKLFVDEQFWNIINYDNWILFQSLHRIYIYNTLNKTYKIITSQTNLPKAFKVDDSIYFQKIKEGIFKIENGKPELILDNQIFKENIVINIFSLGNSLLIQTQEKGFYILTERKLSKWDTKANSIVGNISVYSSLRLKDGSFIIGAISEGVYHIDVEGNIIEQINQKNGLQNNTVLSIFEDVENNVWLGLDNGISVVNFNSPFKVYNDISGDLGTVYTSVIHNEILYLGTNQGVFFKKNNSDNSFNFIGGTEGQVWSLKVIDNTLFCGHNSGTFIINNDKAKLIANVLGTWDIKSIKNNSNLLLQGNYEGFHVLEKKNNTWQLRNKIEGFDGSSRFFELLSDNQIFVSHEYKGVFKLNVANDFSKIIDSKLEESAPKSLKSSIANYENSLYYFVEDGLYKFNVENQLFQKDKILSDIILDSEEYLSGKLVVDDINNTLWTFTNENLVYLSPGKLNSIPKVNSVPFPSSLRNNIVGYEDLSNLKNQTYLFGTSNGYVLFDLNKFKKIDYEVKINSIQKSKLNIEKLPVSFNKNEKLSAKSNNLYFTFSAPVFDKFTEVKYQYQLKGIYDEWSSWSTQSEAIFKNLPYGSYTFNVKAKVGNTVSTNIASFDFIIDRPWYLSNQMLLLYALLLISFFIILHYFYKRHYNKQKQKLVDKKQREFSLVQLEHDKVIMKLRNDKLRSEVEGKTRELAASAMNVIKKNELLNQIKNELIHVKDDIHIKPVVKIINKNLANNSDWELFQEAFNNTDRDFLKKIKLLHNSLTPNDLRLCAYLRLNLSSKEIAPLLNISARSVEIKRYRLRKKMELPHEKSLVEYILEI